MGTTVQQIITESLQDELSSIDFYLALAATTPSPAVRVLAQQFAAEEERHCQMLVDCLAQEGESTLQTALREVRLLLEEPRHKAAVIETRALALVADPLRVVEIAIAKEIESILYFRDLERQVKEPLGRWVLAKICHEEEQHKRSLQRLYLRDSQPVRRYGHPALDGRC